MTVHLEIVGCTTCPFCSHIKDQPWFYCFGNGRGLNKLIGDSDDLDKYTNSVPHYCPLKEGPTIVKLAEVNTFVITLPTKLDVISITLSLDPPKLVEDDDVLI